VEFPVWRGIASSPTMSPEAQAFWASVLKKVTETDTWKNDYISRFLLLPIFMDHRESTEYMNSFEKEFMALMGIR
jgi:putative tricarboxylic transport membrane protein